MSPRRALGAAVIASSLCAGAVLSPPAWAAPEPHLDGSASSESRLDGSASEELGRLLGKKDYLGARVYLRKIARKAPDAAQWASVRDLIFRHPEIGSELVLAWDRRKPEGVRGHSSKVTAALARADALLFKGDADGAFALYQRVAAALKARKASLRKQSSEQARNIDVLYPYVLHGMARALYASGRYADSLEAYSWITPRYALFRQALFEKMWAAFRAGRVDLALGAIASQRSAYFSRYLEPETYLVQIYIYTALCREDDLKRVLAEIERHRRDLDSGKLDSLEWSRSDSRTLPLAALATQSELPDAGPVTRAERAREQLLLREWIKRKFAEAKPRILEHLKLSFAYSQLAASPLMREGLKPIQELPDRAKLLAAGREMWPADSAEDWADEAGAHVFIGQSRCEQTKDKP